MSITLNAAQVNSLVVGGVTVETDLAAAVVSTNVDYVNNIAAFTIKFGNVVNGVFVPGSLPGGVTIAISMVNGGWRVLETGQTGTLGGAGLTTMQTQLKAQRNQGESFANNIGAQPGTVVVW